MMRLSDVAKALNATTPEACGLLGADVAFNSVGSDSRNIEADQLFVAIKGPSFDGNAFACEAIKKGAAAVMVTDKASEARPALLVSDTRLGLGELAKFWRNQFAVPVIAITGSNGKTTTKEMLSAILSAACGSVDKVHATSGNLNNDIGLPLTLLKIRKNHQYVVAEMGMNHLGEIEYLTHITQPDVAVINNAGTAHIGELGSRENIARAKGEIFSGLKMDGIAVINADNDYAAYWQSLITNRKIVTFGLKQSADVSATFQEQASNNLMGSSLVNLSTPDGKISFNLQVQGAHNIYNALAASAAAFSVGISNADIAKGLQSFSGVHGRLERKAALHHAVLIDDTYNANPDSMKAAIDVLAKMPGQKILVLGDMGELGVDAKKMHADIGTYAKNAQIDALYCLGELSIAMTQSFGQGAKHFGVANEHTVNEIATEVSSRLATGVTVLVKGSRFMQMERVVALLEMKNIEGNQ